MNDSVKHEDILSLSDHIDSTDHAPRWQTLFVRTLSHKGLSLPATDPLATPALTVQQECEWHPLSSIAQIIKGRNFSSYGAGRTPLLQGRDLRVDRIDIGALAHKDLTLCLDPFPTTEPGDILLQKLGSRPAAYMISEDESGIAVSETIFMIRLNDPDFSYARFLTAFFNSSHGQVHLTGDMRAAVVLTQSLRHLSKVTVPRPDSSMQQLLIAATTFERQLRREYESAAAYFATLFGLVGGPQNA